MENIATNTQIHANTLGVLGFFLLLFIGSFTCFSQGELSTQNKKALKLYEKADKKYKERDFQGALAFLEEAVKIDTTFFEAYIRMGSLYTALGQQDSVYSKFTSYLRVTSNPILSVQERMAFMAFDRGEYGQAENYLKDFLGKVPERMTDPNIALLHRSLIFAKEQLKNPSKISLKELPPSINSYQLQYLPSITVDGNTLIYTKRDVFSADEDIVVSYKRNNNWSQSQSISQRINTPLNEGANTISADGRTMIFTACDRRDGYGSCDLFVSKKSGEQWSRPRNLGKSVNTKYWESQPSLSADGNILYFTSNRPGGFGGRDIWMTKNIDGNWETPVNLGESINSFKDETTPFIHFNGISLYFSSNSYPGMGGYDLYVSSRQDTIWSEPENLGFPINTYRDEVSFLISSDGSTGYFAKETVKNYEILDSRLVEMQIPDKIKPRSSSYIIGKVVDIESGLPLKASIEIVNLSNDQILYNNSSDSISGEYYMVLPSGEDLAGYIKKKGYLYENFHFDLTSVSESDTLLIALTPIKEGTSLVLENIYFETDSYELNQKSHSEIDNVIQLMNENPSIMVEIAGHTDDVGDDNYNQRLSEKRAEEVYKQLIDGGISKNRLIHKGYGESEPINPNTSEISRKSNRRIEFRVIRSNR